MRGGRELRTFVVFALVTAASLTGCSSGSSGGEKAETLPTSAAASETATDAPAPLTKRKARQLLLTVDDMPTGWAGIASSGGNSAAGTFSPSRCSVMGKSAKKVSTLAVVSFSQGGLAGSRLTQEIYKPLGAEAVDRLAEIKSAMAQCSQYKVRDKTGTTKVTLSALSFPKLADGTLAVRGEIASSIVTATDDVVYVAVGQQIVRFDSVGIGRTLDGQQLEKLVRIGVKRVQAGS